MDKWVNMFDMDRLHTVLTVLRGFRQQYEIVPLPKHVFKMFGMISPKYGEGCVHRTIALPGYLLCYGCTLCLRACIHAQPAVRHDSGHIEKDLSRTVPRYGHTNIDGTSD